MCVGCQSLAAAGVEASERSCRGAASRPSLRVHVDVHVDVDIHRVVADRLHPPNAVRRPRPARRGHGSRPLSWASHAVRTDVEASGYGKRAIASAAKFITHTPTLRTSAMAASVPLSGFGLATQTTTKASTSFAPQSAGAHVPAVQRITATGLTTETISKRWVLPILLAIHGTTVQWPWRQPLPSPTVGHIISAPLGCFDGRGWQNSAPG
jgi:hypothetical protein